MTILTLAGKSLWNRRLTSALVVCSIALSVALLLGVERLRTQARASFANTVSGVDLIVGARGGSINLLLYSVFRIGDPTNNVSWASYRAWAAHPQIAWTVPLSLGDSHRGFRVLGTTRDYFQLYRITAILVGLKAKTAIFRCWANPGCWRWLARGWECCSCKAAYCWLVHYSKSGWD